MSERVHLLAQSILGKSSLEDCTLQETRELAQRYPYFAPAQFLYLQKLRSENNEEYLKQLQKAVLYYHNPLAFEYFISSDRFHTEVEMEQQASVIIDEPQSEPMNTEHTHNFITEMAEADKNDAQPNITGSIAVEETIPVAIETPEISVAGEKELANEQLTDEERSITGERIVAAPEPETSNLKPETSSLKPETSNPNPEPALAFEPYHTVDYFASQGIKLSQEEVSRDKFGKQLKSFTEWLKTMKRLPANQLHQLDTNTEKKVEHLAEDSVHNADVVTEAMAEVWLKQGNREKAIETYNKLSLLNPSKNAYFAALIENLKRS